MNKPNPITAAIGVVKLAHMHHSNPTAVDAATVRDAAAECIQRLSALPAEALELAALYAALLAVTPAGWLPYVTLTGITARPFGTVITDEAGNIAMTATGQSTESLTAFIAQKLSRPMAGCGEATQ
ncbi:MAG: hypothetical protein KJ884_02015 [Gammaproteobacteria bacterium]|uniref:Uncharacterized protein n=1 Tax=viral metagenome TaxID=1070528 RepID=A0A6M3JAE1_9ZZZZ|nr:hypothetical protein [Gammaproteobacteria bacterium]MBU1492248.1 hypothetical protein [Gammaproteobacteria bacterium]MBU2066819.1 hypothetical protein [Gammaproteobacteria bacterium]MBU2137365.1 hypothetical protein [Gammaproteobacteria bacterium]MBU2215074.1 hypothetical protein [Gammaproteobacteria bacterium]